MVRSVSSRAPSPAISKKTTVMLSSPPPLFAARTSAFAAAGRSAAVALDLAQDRLVVDHRGEAVRAEQEEVAGLGLDRERVDVDVGVGAERARDHGPLRVPLRLLGRELAAADELGDQRVVLGQLLELPFADQVGARVADVADRDAAVLDERDRHRRAHPRGGGVLRLPLVDAAVGLLDQVVDPLLAAGELGGLVAQGRRREARGELARLGAAHPVGDREQRRLADVGVLVVPAPPAGVGDARAPSRALTSRTSARSRRRGGCRRASAASRASGGSRSGRCRSSSRRPRPRRRRAAARRARGLVEAYSSRARLTSLDDPRPSSSAAESSVSSSPSSSAGLFTTTSRPLSTCG